MKHITGLIIALIFIPSLAFATNLRGRVDLVHPYSNAPFPARGAEVSLYVQTQNGLTLIASYFTGGDGMYYLQNIRPGNYTLVVNKALRFVITVYNMPSQDLPPILFRY